MLAKRFRVTVGQSRFPRERRSTVSHGHSQGVSTMSVIPIQEKGFVANFAQKVMKGQLPLSVRRLSGQRVEQFGRSEALFPDLNDHLSFLDHVHEFDSN